MNAYDMDNKKQGDKEIILKEWKKEFIDILDSFNIGFALIDMGFRFLAVNKTLLKMTSLPRKKIVGIHAREFFGEAEFQRLRKIVLPRRKEQDYQFEFFLPTASGERIPVLYNQHINRDIDGQPRSIYSMITDIREPKKIQAEMESANQALLSSQERLGREKMQQEAILFGIGDCVTIFDLNGVILLVNPRGQEIRGDRHTPFLPLVSGSQEQVILQVDGEEHQFLGHVQEILDQNGTVYAFLETLKDITAQIKLKEREHELSQIKREMRRNALKTEMIGVSPAIQKVFDMIIRCAEVDSTILVLGETGVGKEVAARAIHAQSGRKDKPFVAVNCGAFPEALLESELFGHVKGAFTGAIDKHTGLFREAGGGTLFLDEIGDLTATMQVKLLRALQEKEIRPVGSSKTYAVDVRVIAATNRSLEELVHQGRFRHDLYYRISVIPFLIPPLRDRKEDILPLSEHFIRKHRKKATRTPITLDHTAQQLLLDYSWPGNVRELENAIEHCLAMRRGPILTPDFLPVQIVENRRPPGYGIQPDNMVSPLKNQRPGGNTSHPNAAMKLSTSEKEAISNALRLHSGNQTLAARDLGISRTTIWRKIKKYRLAG